LAEALGVSPPQMSSLVERLRQQGLLSGRRCPLDRRRQLWRTDLAGCDLLARICAELRELTVSLDRSLSAQQQQGLTELLRRLAGVDGLNPASANPGTADAADSPPLRVFQPDRQDNHCAMEAQYAAVPRKTA
jgi:DNA-binding Lrp family transcriptional regulator